MQGGTVKGLMNVQVLCEALALRKMAAIYTRVEAFAICKPHTIVAILAEFRRGQSTV